MTSKKTSNSVDSASALKSIDDKVSDLVGKVAELTTKNANLSNSYETHQKNNDHMLKMLGEYSIRLWHMEHALGGQGEDNSEFLSLEDKINEVRLRERVLLNSLLGQPPEPEEAPKLLASRQKTIAQQWKKLERQYPKVFEKFKNVFEAGEKNYLDDPVGRLSIDDHSEAQKFKNFISPYIKGRVLDIGCGPQPKPSYLANIENSQISGLDPIAPKKKHPFDFVQGFGEYLPWAAKSFSSVVLATTLDHYCDLDAGLDEIMRVLKPGGYLLAWITETEGAPAYHAADPDLSYADEEHLYHIDTAWLFPMLEKRGLVKFEEMRFSRPFKYVFFVYKKS